jgi:hypothetical protein
VDDALNGPLPICELQPVALKATNSKEALPSKVAQVEATGLNEDEMALIIKRFKTALKGARSTPTRTSQGENAPASNVVRLVTLLHNAPITIMTRHKRSMEKGKIRKTTGRPKARHTLGRNGTPTVPDPTLKVKDYLPRPSTNLRSSPTNAIRAL